MSSRKGVLFAATAAFLAKQFHQTWRKRSDWPFTSYDMFSYSLPETYQQLRVVPYDRAGASYGPFDPWGLLPLEFFRVVSILQGLFMRPLRWDSRAEFCELVLDWINDRPWADFDETRPSLPNYKGERIVALELFLVEVCRDCDPVHRDDVHSFRRLYRHDPLSVVSGEPPRTRTHQIRKTHTEQ